MGRGRRSRPDKLIRPETVVSTMVVTMPRTAPSPSRSNPLISIFRASVNLCSEIAIWFTKQPVNPFCSSNRNAEHEAGRQYVGSDQKSRIACYGAMQSASSLTWYPALQESYLYTERVVVGS